jgi:predicted DNA binding CopG/RHH family protein
MSCTQFAKTDGRESELYKELEKVLGEKDALLMYAKANGNEFNAMFGDYLSSFKNGHADDINLQVEDKVSTRVNDQGEPKLIKKTVVKGDKVTSYNQYYFQFPNGIRKYINKIKFPGMNSDQAEDVSKALLNAFVNENVNENFEDLSRLNPKKLTDSSAGAGLIERFIAAYKIGLTDPELIRRADLVLKHKEDFKIEVLNKIEELGLTYRQSIINEKGESQSELGEDEKAGGINIAESFETNSKETAPAKIKLLLSLLPDTYGNPEFAKAGRRVGERYKWNGDQVQEMRRRVLRGDIMSNITAEDVADLKVPRVLHRVDGFLGKNKFVEFDDVWGTLQPLLSDIVGYNSNGGDLTNALDIMKGELNMLKSVKPWIGGLLERIETMDIHQEAQFVQTFAKSKLNFYVTEIDKGTKKYKIINATSTNSRDSKIRGEWGNNFAKKFTNGVGLTPQGKEDIAQLKLNFTELTAKFGASIAGQPLEVQKRQTLLHIPALIELYSQLGAEIKINDLVSYIRMTGGDEKAPVSMLDLFKSTDYMLKYILDPKTSLVAGDEKVNPFDNQDLIKLISKAKALFEINMAENNVLANNGKSYFAYSNPSYLHNVINEWKRDPSGLDKLAVKAYHKSSLWLNHMLNTEKSRMGVLIASNAEKREKESKRRIGEINIGLASSFKSKGENDGKDTKEISPVDALNDAIAKTLGHKAGGKSYAQTILAADKGRKIEIEGMPTFNSGIDFVNGEWYINDETLTVLANYFEDEYNRMKEVSNDLVTKKPHELKVHYHTVSKGIPNGLKSQTFPSLSPENMDKDSLEYITLYSNGLPLGQENGLYSNSGMTSEQKAVVKEAIKKALSARLDENLKNMDNMGAIHIDETAVNLSVDEGILAAYDGSTDPVRAMSGDFFMNSIINTIEYNKVFLGDPAYFKNMSDMIKRTPASYTDGLQLFLSLKDHEFFNQATVEGVEIASRYVDLIRESVKDKSIADAYTKGRVNSSDAQAWITPKRWKFLKERLGQWTTGPDSHQSAWEKMMKPNPKNNKFETLSVKEMKLVAQPLKGVYFELNSTVPVYLKYSQAVLIPQLTRGTPMQKLLEKMTIGKDGKALSGKDEIHEVITIDGIKVGATSPTKIHEDNGDMKVDFELNSIPLKNRGWKLQQDLPTKLAHETMVGSQIQKNILAGIDIEGKYNFNGKEVAGKEILDLVHSTLGDLSDLGKASLMEEFDIQEDESTGEMKIKNMDRVYSSLISEFKSRGGSDNILAALEKDMPFDAIPQIRNKVENVFMSMMNKQLTKVYTNGGSFIQVSQFGFDSISDTEKSGIQIVSDRYDKKGLKPPHYDKKLKKYMPGQCFMPHSAMLKLLPPGTNWAGMTGKQLMALVDPSALELVTYRIPNQGMSSNDAMEIVGILPPGVGDAIIAYDAVPAKTGSDFDIDKMYVMMPNLHVDKTTGKIAAVPHNENSKGIKAMQNRLIDLYASILKSEHAYDKVMTSIDASFFKDDIVDMFPETKLQDLTFYSPAYQMKTKFEYLSGKIGVAQTANQLVDHMVNRHQNITFDGYLGVGAKDDFGNTKFDNEYDINFENGKGGYAIADTVSAFLNAYVDIAKDPYISRGNHNGITSGVTFMLLRAGTPVKWVNRFIAQPMLSEMTRMTKNSEGITSQDLAIDGERFNATEFVRKSNNLGKKVVNVQDVIAYSEKYSEKQLEDAIRKFSKDGDMSNFTEDEVLMQEETLNIFEYFQEKSKFFGEAVGASKTPDAGDMAQVMVATNKYKNVIANDKIQGFTDKFRNTFTGKYRQNGIDWVSKLVVDNKLFISSNPTLQSTINSMSERTGKGPLSTNEDFIKSISADFYSYAMSGLSIFKKNIEDIDVLFTQVPKDIQTMKEAKSSNFLIQELEIRSSGGYDFLKINSKNKPKTYNNKIYRAWVDLLRSDIQAERVLGTRLIKYAFSQSGFKTNLNQFFTHIPHEALINAGVNEHIREIHSEMSNLDLDQNFRDQMFRHSAGDRAIVQRVSSKNIKRVGTTTATAGFVYDESTETKGGISTGLNKDGGGTFPEFVSRVFKDDGSYSGTPSETVVLYKMIGMSKSVVVGKDGVSKEKFMPTYVRTFKLGAKFNNGSIVEYQYNTKSNKSVVAANNISETHQLEINEFMSQATERGLFMKEEMMAPTREKEIKSVPLSEDEESNTSENPLTC